MPQQHTDGQNQNTNVKLCKLNYISLGANRAITYSSSPDSRALISELEIAVMLSTDIKKNL